MNGSTSEQMVAPASPAIAEPQPHHPGPARKQKHHQRSEVRPCLSGADREAMLREEFFSSEYNPYQRITSDELRWMNRRDRGPDTNFGWAMYVCLCGPIPGPQSDPNEVWPGRQKITRARDHRRGSDGTKRSRRPRPAKEAPVFKEEPKALIYREEAFRALGGEQNELQPSVAVVFARHLGFIPSLADEKRLESMKPITQASFDKWITSIAHTEDADQQFLCEAFKMLDYKVEGTISEFALATVLSTMGETVTPAEVAEIVEMTGSRSGGKVRYKEFVAGLLSMNRKLPPASTLAAHGVDVSALPPQTVTEATHFASPPSILSDIDDDEDSYTQVDARPAQVLHRPTPRQWLTAHAR